MKPKRKLSDFRQQAQNLNKHTERGMGMLEQSMQEVGYSAPMVAAADGEILDGSARHETAANVFGADAEPIIVESDGKRPIVVVRTDIKDAKTRAAKRLAAYANRTGQVNLEWDSAELKAEDVDMFSGIFADGELEKLLAEQPQMLPQGEQDFRSLVATLKEDVRFPGAGKWEIPILREDRLFTSDQTPVLWWPSDTPEPGLKLWNYNSDSTKGMDWHECVVGFYVDDSRFESVWSATADHIQPLINRGIAGMISPNFSTYSTFPAALRLWNVFRSRWVARYAQEAGLRIVVDIAGMPDDAEWLFDGIPTGAPVCFQCHREKKEAAQVKDAVLAAMISKVSPYVIWCYGQSEKAGWYPSLEGKDCRWITPRSVKQRQRIERSVCQQEKRREA